MTVVYPVVFTPLEEGGYLAYVPDLKINTHGEDLAQAILMARDAIGVIGLDIEDDGDPLPVPSKSVPHQDNEIVSLVDVDLAAYRRAHDMRTVRRNVPAQLPERARGKGRPQLLPGPPGWSPPAPGGPVIFSSVREVFLCSTK